MPDNLTELTARLERLVSEIMKETDPVRYDALADEIWQALGERECLMKQSPQPAMRRSVPPDEDRVIPRQSSERRYPALRAHACPGEDEEAISGRCLA